MKGEITETARGRFMAKLVNEEGKAVVTSAGRFKERADAQAIIDLVLPGALKMGSLKGQVTRLTKERDAAVSRADDLQREIGEINNAKELLNQRINNLEKDNATLRADMQVIGANADKKAKEAIIAERRKLNDEKGALRVWIWTLAIAAAMSLTAVLDLKYGVLPW